MPYNGFGVFQRLFNWVADRDAGIKISAERFDQELDGIAAALSNAITKDGQTTPVANIPLGGKKLTNLGAPTNASDAATKDYVDSVATGTGTRVTVRVATTANVNLSNELENGDTLDGVTLATGDLILVKDQSAQSQNGIYVVPASGAASRHSDFDTFDEHAGSIVAVSAGTTNANTLWICMVNAGGTLGTTAITYSNSTPTVNFPITIEQGGHGQASKQAGFDALSPVTTRGDIIVRGASNNVRLALGAAGTVLGSDGTDALWRTLSAALDAALGSTQGNILYRGASAWAVLAPGTAGHILTTGGAGANPSWAVTSGAKQNYQTFTSSGTWTKPSGFSADALVVIECWGGGGGGSGGGVGGGGGGGGYNYRFLRLGNLGSTESVTVGGGGAAGGTTGSAGGTTSFGSHVSAYGGGGGSTTGTAGGGGGGGGQTSAGTSGNGANGGGGGGPIGGGEGTSGVSGGGGGGSTANNGGNGFYGGGGGGRASGGNGGISVWGGGGGGGSTSGTGGASTYAGAGGDTGVAGTAPAGGGGRNAAGARGECRVWVVG